MSAHRTGGIEETLDGAEPRLPSGDPHTRSDRGQRGRRSAGMFRYERANYFERLVELHLAYAMRGEEDGTSVMSIDEAIAWVEAEIISGPITDGRETSEPE